MKRDPLPVPKTAVNRFFGCNDNPSRRKGGNYTEIVRMSDQMRL